jgi:hypothetical protein
MIMDTNLTPSRPSSSETPSSTTISYHPSAYSPPLNLPPTPNSVPGLEFVGFDHKTATHIFKTYDKYKEPSSSPEASNYDFFSCVHGHIIHINSANFGGLEDAEKLRSLGVRKEVAEAILDEGFRDVFGTQRLEYWIEDTIKVNYATLLRLQDQAIQKEPDMSSEDLFKHCPIIDSPPNPLNNHTTLYKAMVDTSFLDSEPHFLDTGHLNISSLSSPRGNVFNGQTSAIYLTPQRQTAEMLRRYISLRCPGASTFLISIFIPNNFLFSLRMEEVYFSETWKEFIWCCRTKTPLPGHLQHLGDADVVKGTICTKPDIVRLSLQDLQSKLTEDDVFVHEDGEKGVQWCLKEEKVREVLGCGGKVHVEVFDPSLRVKD